MDKKQDVQKIIDYLHDFAEVMLNEGKEFYPFGAAIDNEGELIPVGYEDDETDKPKSLNVIEVLTKHFQNDFQDNKIRAYGLTYDVQIKYKDQVITSDAVLIDIVLREAIDIPIYYFTYSFNDQNKVVFGESFGRKR